MLAVLPAPGAFALTAAGPGPGRFMWQGSQREFVRADGSTCTGRVAVAVAKHAVCYVATDDTLRCAGSIGGKKFGPRFVPAGMTGVEQILISPTRPSFYRDVFGLGPKSSICVKKTDGTAWCAGVYNDFGQFGNGTTGGSKDFVRWGRCANDLVALGTGNWEQICALDRHGQVSCSGSSYGSWPMGQEGTGHASFWIDPAGTLHLDDPATYRVSNGRTDCRVRPRTPGGFICHKEPNGLLRCRQVPGDPDDLVCNGGTPWLLSGANLWKPPQAPTPLIVDGGTFVQGDVGLCGGNPPPFGPLTIACWLTVDGHAFCTCRSKLTGVAEFFMGVRETCPTCDWPRLLALATDPYSETMCAVPEDGSLWCIGANASGKLGTGAFDDLDDETQVQPAGSVRTGCEATTTTTSTTSTTTTTGTGPCCDASRDVLSFTFGPGVGSCGSLTSMVGTTLRNLTCGGLYFGSGLNSVPLPVNGGGPGAFLANVSSCNPGSGALALTARTAAETGSSRTCTAAGCLFGAPLPIPNAGSTPTSTCVTNSVTQDLTGSGNCGTGTAVMNLPLRVQINLSGDLLPALPGIQACPICAPSFGNDTCPGDPCSACCHGGLNHLKPCSPDGSASGVSFATSQDCPPDPLNDIGGLPIALGLTTGSAAKTAVDLPAQARVFCGFCRDGNNLGSGTLAFENPAHDCTSNADCTNPAFPDCEQRNPGAFSFSTARTIGATGVPAGSLRDGLPHASTLVSVFCIPPTFTSTVDNAADLPGPGAVSFPGAMQLGP